MRAVLIQRHWPGQASQWSLFVTSHDAKLKYFSTSFLNAKNRGTLPKKYLLRGQNRRGEDPRKILEDLTHRELVTRGSKALKQSVPAQKPIQRWTGALSKITTEINKKSTQAATNFPAAIQRITDKLRDPKNHQALRENGQILLKYAIQPVATRISDQLSKIPHEGFFKPSRAEVESVLGILNSTRDELEAHIAALDKNIEDDGRDEQRQSIRKELHQQLIQIQDHINYLAVSHDTKGDAKHEQGIENALIKNQFLSSLAAVAHVKLYFSTSFLNAKNNGALPKKYLLRGQNRRGDDARKILEDLTHLELVTRGLKALKQSVPAERPIQRWTGALSEIATEINKKSTQAAKNFPAAIQRLTDTLRDPENHQALRENGQILLKYTIQPVVAKVSDQLSKIRHEGFFKPSRAEVESVLAILKNTRDELEVHIAALQNKIEDDGRDEQRQLIRKELQQQLTQIQGRINYLTVNHDTKDDAKQEKGIVNALIRNRFLPSLAAVSLAKLSLTVGIQNKIIGHGPATLSNESQHGLSSVKELPQDGGTVDDDAEIVFETGALEQQHGEGTMAPNPDCGGGDQDESTNEIQEVEAESYLDAIQRKATEMLEHNVQTGVQKHVERLNVLKEEACGLGVEMDDAFAKCEEELQELSSVYTNRTKQMLQDMAAGTLRPITDVRNNISECSATVYDLTREIRDSIKDQSSYLKLAALTVQTATALALVPTGVAMIPRRMTASVMRMPSQVSKIILANVQEADSHAGEIVGKLVKQVEDNKETHDD